MYRAITGNQMAERDLHEFEVDLKRYEAANRRSVVLGALMVLGLLFTACMVCSAAYLLIR